MKKFQVKSALLTLLAVGFVALFAVGCGNSRENFVITGNNNNVGATTGNLLFRFQQATAQQIVPANTTQIRFDFFTGNPPSTANFLETRTENYADEVLLTGIDSNVKVVTATAIGSDGSNLTVPLFVYQASDITVIPGTTVEVQFDNNGAPVTLTGVTFTPNPVNLVSDMDSDGSQQLSALLAFSNGSTFNGIINNQTTSCTFSNAGVATISPAGLVEQTVIGDNTTATCTYTIGSQSVNDSIFISAFGFKSEPDGGFDLTPTGGYNGGWTTEFRDDDGITVLDNVTLGSTFALGTGAPSNLTIDTNTGIITNSGTTPDGTDVDVVITWPDGRTDGTGLTFTDVVTLSTPAP